MKQLRRAFVKFFRLFTNSRAEAELEREIAAHLVLLEDQYLSQGMSPDDARLAARRAYGGVEQAKQLHRNERSYQGLAQAVQDARYTLRQLRKSPGFTAAAILMLALGIGTTTAIFSIVEGVLLRPLPFPDPDRLVVLGDILEGSNCAFCTHSHVTAPDIRSYLRDTQSFINLGGYLDHSELWVPLSLQPEEFTAGSAASWTFRMVGRLKPGVTAAQAQSDAQRVAQETMRNYPAFMRSLRIRSVVTPLEEDTVEQALLLVRTLLFAVVVVLLIACANLAGLLLLRSIRRRREIAVRLALGARAATLLRQAIVESLVLSIAGGVVGLALAAVALRLGVSLLPETLPRIHEIGLDWPVVAFALGLALLTGFLCGLAPAFAAIRTSVNETLKESGRTGTSGSGHGRLRSALVVAEIAVALVLLTASGLLLRSFEKMRAVDMGFRPDHTLAAVYVLPQNQYSAQPTIDQFAEDLLRKLRQLPGVEAAGITSLLPAAGNEFGIAFTLEDYVPAKGAGLNMAAMSMVHGDPFQALGIRLLRGRLFNESDKTGSQLVAIVNHKMAERYWPGQDPIGKRLRRGMPETATPWMTIVGEVDDVKLGSPDGETALQVYQPLTQTVATEGVFAAAGELSGTEGWIVLRTSEAPEQMENSLRAVMQSLDPQLPLYQMQTMEHAISGSEAPRRFNTVLISCFAIVAVLLSVLGIYSVIAFTVALREQEMALRMALGCQPSGVRTLILTSGVKLAAVGCVLGLLGALGASRLLLSFLFGVSPFDPVVLSLSAVVMLLLGLASSALPAKRAARTDPMLALRGE